MNLYPAKKIDRRAAGLHQCILPEMLKFIRGLDEILKELYRKYKLLYKEYCSLDFSASADLTAKKKEYRIYVDEFHEVFASLVTTVERSIATILSKKVCDRQAEKYFKEVLGGVKHAEGVLWVRLHEAFGLDPRFGGFIMGGLPAK